MGRFYGRIGYVKTEESTPGVWEEVTSVRSYYGDELTVKSRWASGDKINDDIVAAHKISVVADPFAYSNFHHIRWVEWLGTKWTADYIEVERPRLVITLGGVYNAVG